MDNLGLTNKDKALYYLCLVDFIGRGKINKWLGW